MLACLIRGEIRFETPDASEHLKIRALPLVRREIHFLARLRIDEHRTALRQRLHNRVRAVNPWPGAWCEWNEDYCRQEAEPLKIWRTQVLEGNYGGAIPGAILKVEDEAILVQTGDGILRLQEVQSPGKPRMNAAAWSRGHHAGSGKKFD